MPTFAKLIPQVSIEAHTLDDIIKASKSTYYKLADTWGIDYRTAIRRAENPNTLTIGSCAGWRNCWGWTRPAFLLSLSNN